MGGCDQPGVRNQDSRLHIGCLYGFHLASWPHGRSTAQGGTVEVSFALSLVPEHHHWLLAAVPDERCLEYRWHRNTPAALLPETSSCNRDTNRHSSIGDRLGKYSRPLMISPHNNDHRIVLCYNTQYQTRKKTYQKSR